MKQKRKFENNNILNLSNLGQKSLYFGIIILTFLILFIGKADLAILNKVSIVLLICHHR